MASSSDMKSMYQSNVKAQLPDCEGKHYASDSATPEYLNVSLDSNGNELAEDRPFHATGLAGDSGRFGSKQFASDFSSYGQAIDGANSSVERIAVDSSRADRGKES